MAGRIYQTEVARIPVYPTQQGQPTHVDNPAGKIACGITVATVANQVPNPMVKAAAAIVGGMLCQDVYEGKIGSEPPPNPLKGPDGTT